MYSLYIYPYISLGGKELLFDKKPIKTLFFGGS